MTNNEILALFLALISIQILIYLKEFIKFYIEWCEEMTHE